MQVHMRHIREAKLCAGGARKWFLSFGFSWQDFLLNGMSVEQLEATGDALAFRVTALARAEAQRG